MILIAIEEDTKQQDGLSLGITSSAVNETETEMELADACTGFLRTYLASMNETVTIIEIEGEN